MRGDDSDVDGDDSDVDGDDSDVDGDGGGGGNEQVKAQTCTLLQVAYCCAGHRMMLPDTAGP